MRLCAVSPRNPQLPPLKNEKTIWNNKAQKSWSKMTQNNTHFVPHMNIPDSASKFLSRIKMTVLPDKPVKI